MTNVSVTCPDCKEVRIVKKWRNSWGNEKTCKKCSNKTLHKKNTGSKHPMSEERLAKHRETVRTWRAAKNEKQKVWKRSERSQWSLDVRKRDGYTCILCRTEGIGREMHAHHILAASQYPEWSLTRLNGITLCRTCHKSVHNGGK